MLWTCRRCGCRFAVGLRMCPQCTSEEIERDEETGMAKITVHGGPSNEAAEHEAQREGEQPSAGKNSETSTGKPETPPSEATTSKPARARTTGNRSRRDRTASSSAASTGTGQTSK